MICYKLLIFSVISVWQLVEKNSINFCPGVYYIYIYISLSLFHSHIHHILHGRGQSFYYETGTMMLAVTIPFLCVIAWISRARLKWQYSICYYLFFSSCPRPVYHYSEWYTLHILGASHCGHDAVMWHRHCSSSQHHRHFRSGLPAPHPHSASLSIYPSGSASGTAFLWACSQHHYGHM